MTFKDHRGFMHRIDISSLFGIIVVLSVVSWGGMVHAADSAQDQQMDHSKMDHSKMDHAKDQANVEDPHAKHKQAAAKKAGQAGTAEIEIADGFTMLNQHGEAVDFRRDIIGDRIAVIDFVYTSCTTVCPVVSTIFSQLENRLGTHMEQDVALVTITVDPARDTPHRLKSYSENFNPGPNWSWLTGEKQIVDKVLTELGAYTPLYEDHPAMVLVGDENKSEWYRYYGFPDPKNIEAKVVEMLASRQL